MDGHEPRALVLPHHALARLLLPADEDIVMGIALGYAAEDDINDFASSRLPLEDILSIKQ